MSCIINQDQEKVFTQLLHKFCEQWSDSPLCKEIKETGCVGDGYYLVNGEGRNLRILRSKNLDGPTVWKEFSVFGRIVSLPFKGSRTERYSIAEHLQPSIDEGYTTGGGSTMGDALFCLIPVIGWAMCASGCSGDDGRSGPHMEEGNFPPMDIWLDVPLDAGKAHGETGDEKELDAADGLTDAKVGADMDEGAPIVDIIEKDHAEFELPNDETPSNVEDAWQSSYESLGLCLNEATSCIKAAESGCWEIKEINSSKPNTLAFLDPGIDSVDLKLESGPYNGSANHTFERIEAGTVMENGYFDSTIWLAPGLLLAADYVGDTVDIMLSQSDYNIGDLGACEYIYNYPCPGLDGCN